MRGILKRQGYEVIEAADYNQAVGLNTTHPGRIDLFLIDLRLPDGSGYDLSVELRAAHPGSKILYISGTAGAELCKYFETPLQEVQFLHKPFQAADLARRLPELSRPDGEPLAANAAAGGSATLLAPE